MANLQRVDHQAEFNLDSVDMPSQWDSQLKDSSQCTDTAHPSSNPARNPVCNQAMDTVLLRACRKPRLLANSRLRSKCMATVRLCKDSQGSSLLTTRTANLPSEVAERQVRLK